MFRLERCWQLVCGLLLLFSLHSALCVSHLALFAFVAGQTHTWKYACILQLSVPGSILNLDLVSAVVLTNGASAPHPRSFRSFLNVAWLW